MITDPFQPGFYGMTNLALMSKYKADKEEHLDKLADEVTRLVLEEGNLKRAQYVESYWVPRAWL